MNERGKRQQRVAAQRATANRSWVQLLREAFSFENVPRFLLFTGAGTLSSDVASTLRSMGAPRPNDFPGLLGPAVAALVVSGVPQPAPSQCRSVGLA